MTFSTAVLNVLAKLRPPFARSSLLLYPWSLEEHENQGITVGLPAGENAIAPGDGTVASIHSELPDFYTQNTLLLNHSVITVVIDHGNEVTSKISGLSSTPLTVGQPITRGDLLGSTAASEIFFGIAVSTKPFNPLAISQHFQLQDGNAVTGQTGRIRFAPDLLNRDLSSGVATELVSGKRYFSSGTNAFLVNIDFNGAGGKSGTAVSGLSQADYWNVYAPISFTGTQTTDCSGSGYTGTVYSDVPWLPLLNFDQSLSVAYLERVPPLMATAGSLGSFDPMLSTHVGNFGVVNQFNLRSVPAGNYSIFVYGYSLSAGSTSVSVSVDGTAPSTQSMVSGAFTGTWVAGQNYVESALLVDTSGKVGISVNGILSGVQLIRTAN